MLKIICRHNVDNPNSRLVYGKNVTKKERSFFPSLPKLPRAREKDITKCSSPIQQYGVERFFSRFFTYMFKRYKLCIPYSFITSFAFPASQQCFQGSRKVMFMLDSSRRLRARQVPDVLEFIAQITEKLYVEPSNIAVGLAQYSNFMVARTELAVESRPLNETLHAIRNLEYQYGSNNFVGDALEFIGNEVSAATSVHTTCAYTRGNDDNDDHDNDDDNDNDDDIMMI